MGRRKQIDCKRPGALVGGQHVYELRACAQRVKGNRRPAVAGKPPRKMTAQQPGALVGGLVGLLMLIKKLAGAKLGKLRTYDCEQW